MTQVTIKSLEHLRELKGQLICLELDLDYLKGRGYSASEFKKISDCNRFLWKVGKIEAAKDMWDSHVVCWHADNPDVGICIKDSNIIPNDYNDHKAFVYDSKVHGTIIPSVTESYSRINIPMYIERDDFDAFRKRWKGEEDA